jgi:hypothetical protein
MLHTVRTEENYVLEDCYEEYSCVRTYRQVQLLQILIRPSSDATWLTNYPRDGQVLKKLLSTDDSLMQRWMTGLKHAQRNTERETCKTINLQTPTPAYLIDRNAICWQTDKHYCTSLSWSSPPLPAEEQHAETHTLVRVYPRLHSHVLLSG